MGKLYKRASGVWFCDFVDRDGNRVRRSTKLRDKQLAAKALAKWENEERLVEIGLKPRAKDGELESVLKQFESSLTAAGRSDDHVERTGRLIRAAASHNRWKRLSDISADGINLYAKHLGKDNEYSSRTISSMMTAVRTFCRWCIPAGYLTGDPTAGVKKPSSIGDRRIERRMLLPEEWRWVRVMLENSESIKNGQDNTERLLMYRVAIETGLRSGELRSLKKASLTLKVAEPHVHVRGAVTKNAKDAKQYISNSLAAELLKRLDGRPPGSLVFDVADRLEMARTLRDDIAEARKLWLATKEGEKEKDSDFLQSPNSHGEVLDFHALRHTCGAWLVMQGVTLAEVREIMRHSTITLTVDCYGHLAPDARSRSRHVLGAMM